MVFDYDLTTMYLYGGESANFFYEEDLWKYNVSTNTWTRMVVTNNITLARSGSAVQALSQSAKKRIVVFAGSYIDSGGVTTLAA